MRIVFLVIVFAFSLFAQSLSSEVKEAVVKIYSSAKVPNFNKPWVSSNTRSSGSGAVIDGNLILTNAHVVSNATFLEVQKYNSAKRYIAKVIAVCHTCDLALITTEDKSFFKGVKPLKIGNLPYPDQKILVAGYPMGGNTLSVTSGIVSRIEHQTYVHSGESLLAIQVDAAINPGNSGGPAIINGKIVGVAMQGITMSQNIGYLVPSVMIKHFLDDFKDGKVNGVPELHILVSTLENPAIKRFYGLKDNQTGIVVNKVLPLGNSAGILKSGDVILEVEGKKIQDDGTIEFRKNEFTSAKYAIDMLQFGQEAHLKILRDKEIKNIKIKLNKTTDSVWLVKLFRYDIDPTYFIYDGYVFSPLVENIIDKKRRNCKLKNLLPKPATKDKQEQVVMLGVLSDRSNRGNQDLSYFLVDKVNGKKIKDFKEFYNIVSSKKDGFIVLENSMNKKIVIDVKEAQKRDKIILDTYNIQYAKSKDL